MCKARQGLNQGAKIDRVSGFFSLIYAFYPRSEMDVGCHMVRVIPRRVSLFPKALPVYHFLFCNALMGNNNNTDHFWSFKHLAAQEWTSVVDDKCEDKRVS